MVGHDDRYKMADDLMNLVYKLFERAWEKGALTLDKNGDFADPTKIHRISHEGPYFKSEGFGNTSYSPQGTPVLFQAGMSPAGRAFGGKHGECMFVLGAPVETLRKTSEAMREQAVQSGRSNDTVENIADVSGVIAENEK